MVVKQAADKAQKEEFLNGQGSDPPIRTQNIKEVVITKLTSIKQYLSSEINMPSSNNAIFFAHAIPVIIKAVVWTIAAVAAWDIAQKICDAIFGDKPKRPYQLKSEDDKAKEEDNAADKVNNGVEVPSEGGASRYEDTTKSKQSVKNRDTDFTKGEFEKNLEKSGYK